MLDKLYDFLICPECKSNLALSERSNLNELCCSVCDRSYPIVNNIPRLVEDSNNYVDSFGFQWTLHAKTQLDSFTGIPISRDRLHSATHWDKQNLQGQTIFEAGSGAGRFTEILAATGATVLSMDYSNAVEANFSNNGHRANVGIFQGDILKLPLRKNSFDKVICLGVLQHTENPDVAFRCLTELVKPGGELVVDVYAARLTAFIGWQYWLRPITRQIPKHALYKIISLVVPVLMPLTYLLSHLFGRVGRKMMPIPEYSYLGLPYNLNVKWSILDAFDIYSPTYDQPRSQDSVKKWYLDAQFTNVSVRNGLNGIVASGKKSLSASTVV